MKKTKIVALALAVIMALSVIPVIASAAYTAPSCRDFETIFAGGIAEGKVTVNSKVSSNGVSWSPTSASIAQQKSTYPNLYNWKDGEQGVILINKYPGAKNFNQKTINGETVYGDYLFIDGTKGNSTVGIVDEGNNCVRLESANGNNIGYALKDYAFGFSTNVKFLNFDGGFNIFTAGLKPNADNGTGRAFFEALNLDANGVLLWKTASLGVQLSTGIYYNISMILSPKDGTIVADIYLDGIQVANDLLFVGSANYEYYFSYMLVNKISGACSGVDCDCTPEEKTQITNAPVGYSNSDIGSNKFYMCEHDKQIAYMKDAAFYYIETDYLASNPTFSPVVLNNSGNTVEGYDLTINNGTLGLNYYLNLTADVLADQNAKVVFTTPRGEVQETLVKDVDAETNGTYKFTATVSSVEMAGDITMKIVSGEKTYNVFMGGKASTTYKYSVKAYAEKLLTDANYGAIAKAMLNYGAAAQTYFEFDTENLANANCAYTTELDAVGADISAVTIAGNTGAGTKAALVLDSNTSIVIYDKDGNKIGEKTGINSLNLDASYDIACGDKTVTVSVLAIGEKVLASSTASAEYKALVKALKLFSDASKAL